MANSLRIFSHDATARQLQTILGTLLGESNVYVRGGDGSAGTPYQIELLGDFVNTDQPLFEVADGLGGALNNGGADGVIVSKAIAGGVDDPFVINFIGNLSSTPVDELIVHDTSLFGAITLETITEGQAAVTVTGSGTVGSPFRIEFLQSQNKEIPTLVAGFAGMLTTSDTTATVVTTQEGGNSNEIQAIYSDATTGQFQLEFGGLTTNLLSHDISALALEVELLNVLGAGNFTIAGAGTSDNPWLIEFIGAYEAQDVSLISLAAGDTQDGTGLVIESVQDGVTGANEVMEVFHDASRGGFALEMNGSKCGARSITTIWPVIVKAAIEMISGINVVNVTGDGTATSPWIVEVQNPGGTDVEPLEVVDSTLQRVDTPVTFTTETLTEGADQNEIQTLYHNGTTGTFKFRYAGVDTVRAVYNLHGG